MTAILNNGVYSFAEAASLTQLQRSRVREWFRIRSNNGRKAIFVGEYEPIGGNRAISFLDLIDVFVAGQLREHGVSLQTLRKVYARMSADLNTKHPFSRRELLSDGKKVFLRGLDEEGREELEEALTHQRVFPQFLLPFLKRIAYDEVTHLASRWRIAEAVVIDPAICFGKPVVEAVGIPTAILAAAYDANDKDAAAVADWYNVKQHQVMAAVQFEQKFAA
jgi:uncharacterized protein (DUF433 family)